MTIAKVHTDGLNKWAKSAKEIRIESIELEYLSRDVPFGQVRVYFNTDDWDVNSDGKIYNDATFLKELRSSFGFLGYGEGIAYAAWRFQTKSYVVFDVDESFLAHYSGKHHDEFESMVNQMKGNK